MKKQFFVTGTDTGVGKTVVSAALLHLANKASYATIGLKPVAAGCVETNDGMRNEDAEMLQRFASVSLSYSQINPVALADPIAPHIAAEKEGRRLSADRVAGFCRGAMMQKHDVCIVEGAGGWRVPLNSRETMAAIPKQLGLPVVIVVGVRLGCISHALLTAESVSRDGLTIAGWVANVISEEMPVMEENVNTLEAMFSFPMLGCIPFRNGITPESASAHLDINKLLDFGGV